MIDPRLAAIRRPVPSLYVHVPFCPFRCAYCDFDFTTRREGTGRYLAAVAREAALFAGRIVPETIFFGGGTPSLLTEVELDALARVLPIDPARLKEWSIEANPETVTEGKARLWRALGVTRVSVGAQTFSDARLKALGREAKAADTARAWDLLRKAGFTNLNLDLILGAPGTGQKELAEDLDAALALGPEHLSAYALTVEEKTPLGLAVARGEISPPSDLELAGLYETAARTLDAAGLHRYEVSNFARPGRECLHNLHTWRGGEYLGLGPSAASFAGGLRGANVRGEGRYAERIEREGTAFQEELRLDDAALARERLALGLRLAEGVEWSAGWPDETLAAIERLLAEGLVAKRGGRLVPTDRGFLFADEISAALL